MLGNGKGLKPPEIDFTKIAFPSDKVTIGAIRDHIRKNDPNPAAFERTLREFEPEDFELKANILALLSAERELAEDAFNAALKGVKPKQVGQIHLELAENRRDRVQDLDRFYTEFGITSGPKQTVELARTIEAAAVAQAKQHLGKTP